MIELWLILGLTCLAWHWYTQRKFAEFARQHMAAYCRKNGLQLLSIAKVNSRLIADKHRGLVWRNVYHVEFNGDGESCYQGKIILKGTQLEAIELPPYRI